MSNFVVGSRAIYLGRLADFQKADGPVVICGVILKVATQPDGLCHVAVPPVLTEDPENVLKTADGTEYTVVQVRMNALEADNALNRQEMRHVDKKGPLPIQALGPAGGVELLRS